MTFETEFEQNIKDTIRKHNLLSKKDKIVVACSGGKDSTTVLYLLHKWGYDVEGLIIDLRIGAWSNIALKNFKKFVSAENIPHHIIDIRDELGGSMCYLRSCIQSKSKLNNCTICGVFKRWILNKQARERGYTKIVTGHNIDDEAETVMMNMFRSTFSLAAGMGPIAGVEPNKKFVTRVKPLYDCLNSEVRRYSELKKFPVDFAPCPCSTDVLRRNVRNMLNDLEKENPDVKRNIVVSFLKMLPKVTERYKKRSDEGIRSCKHCGEPTVGDVCQTCKLLKMVGRDQ